ncbi:Tektin-1 [Acropora cervicornis]|uniref:Tektin n=1 Tax=Acropora cervicornis TaxID=6130 RepID=A0AAD9VHY3_ACRCE|nr:Tektin-1 [Acropora cervicornis]
MARLVQPPPKYTPEEWHASNHLQYFNAERERAAAERLRDESFRLAHETEVRTRQTQLDVNKKLDQRITDINFWKSELDQKQEDTVNEITMMLQFKARLERALADTELPLMIAQQCLANREKRMKVDLVHDNVEMQLLKEVEVIEGVQALLQRTLEQATEQIRLLRQFIYFGNFTPKNRLLRSAKYYLDKDRKDKFQANNIDNTCASLENTTQGLRFAKEAVKVEKNSVTPDEWEDFSNKNILKAEREKNSAINLRSIIDGILMQTLSDLQAQCEAVNLAFQKRIEETVEAKTKLEEHLAKVMDEIAAMEQNIAMLKKAIADKEAPMKVSQTRLENRTFRPNVELCRDRVQYRLLEEVFEISTNIERLHEKLADAEASLKGLIRKQLSLEEDIEVKANSLFIDRDQCMELRKQINHVSH